MRVPARRAAVLALAAALVVVAPSRPLRAQDRAEAAAPADRPPFAEWLADFRAEAASLGVSAETLERELGGLEPVEQVVERDRTQAETVLTVEQYLQRRLTTALTRRARTEARRYRTLLGRVARHYGVQSRVIVAVWGMESNFGRFSGVRPTIQALATLAWDGRRGALFRQELIHALEILDRGHIDSSKMKGSWAGAMGQPQFMPSSYLRYAEDFDGDGRRDIWGSTADIFASVANYLKAHGWSDVETWGREVRLPAGGADPLFAAAGRRETGCRAEREMSRPVPLAEWERRGVRTTAGRALPRVDRDASLVQAGARAFLVYGNYEALLEYNCAHAYALSVGLLSDRIGR
ncbi:MAG: lytic transglycosylase domain-containing protein [Vicinamibacterales bacterium]